MISNGDRNITLDWFKVLLSVLVALVHLGPIFTEPTNSIQTFFNSTFAFLGHISVPCFFIISGYYASRLWGDYRKLARYVKHLLLLYVIWELIYLPFFIYDKHLRLYIIFGFTHLWFVPSLMGGIVVLFLLKKWELNNKIILLMAFCLFISGYFIQHRVNTTIGWIDGWYKYRNFLFFGFPFICIGYFIKEFKIDDKVKNWQVYLVCIIFLVLFFIEIDWTGASDLHLSSLVLCPFLFIAVLKNSRYGKSDGYLEDLSGAIYFVHIYALSLLSGIISHSTNKIYIIPQILFVILLLSSTIIYTNKRIKILL